MHVHAYFQNKYYTVSLQNVIEDFIILIFVLRQL